MNFQQKLTSEEFDLRLINTEDEGLFHQIYSDPLMMKYVGDVFSLEQSSRILKRIITDQSKTGKYLFYVIVLKGSCEKVGVINIAISENQKSAEIGVMINRKWHNQGLASKSKQLLISYAHKYLNISHFIAYCDAANEATMKLLNRLGYKIHEQSQGDDTGLLSHKWLLSVAS